MLMLILRQMRILCVSYFNEYVLVSTSKSPIFHAKTTTKFQQRS